MNHNHFYVRDAWAYDDTELITGMKRFIVQAPGIM